jgi:CRISPR type I-E-associated protein CasB/Cse2
VTNEENKPTIGKASLGWWISLQPDPDKKSKKKGDSGALARLRRADINAAATEEVTFDLHRRLEPATCLRGTKLLGRAALIATVLAHVRDPENRKVAAAAGEMIGDGQRVLQPLRLRRLLATRTPDECLTAFRRLVALLDRTANVADLAECLFDWPDEFRGDQRRTRFAFDYYGADASAPQESNAATA